MSLPRGLLGLAARADHTDGRQARLTAVMLACEILAELPREPRRVTDGRRWLLKAEASQVPVGRPRARRPAPGYAPEKRSTKRTSVRESVAQQAKGGMR